MRSASALAPLVVLLVLVAISPGAAAWGVPIPISDPLARPEAPAIAVDGSKVYAVWADDECRFRPSGGSSGVPSDAITSICIRRNMSGGEGDWGPTCAILPELMVTSASEPDVAALGGTVYVVWAQQERGTEGLLGSGGHNEADIWSVRMTAWDGDCPTWYGPLVFVGQGGSGAENVPRVVTDGVYAHIALLGDGPLGYQPWYYRWDGVFLGDPTRTVRQLTYLAEAESLAIALSGPGLGRVTVAFSCRPTNNVAGVWEVDAVSSADGGLTWRNLNTRCTAPLSGGVGTNSVRVALAGTVGTVHLTWTEVGRISTQVYHRRSLTGGATWEAIQLISDPGLGSHRESRMAGYLNCVGIVYEGRSSGRGPEIHFRQSTNWGGSWGPQERATSGSFDRVPALSIDPRSGGGTCALHYHVAFLRMSGETGASVYYLRE